MNIASIRICAFVSALCATFALCAQEDSAEAPAKEGATASTDGLDPALVQAAAAKPKAKFFHELVRFMLADGEVSVRLPNQHEFKMAVEGKFYPNGSTFRVVGKSAQFEFGKDAALKVNGDAEFSTATAEIGSQPRTVIPARGAFTISLPRTLPTGLFSVAYPNFTVKDLAGESKHELAPSGDGDEAVVHVITGMLALEGPHYTIARMSAADRIRIRTTGDRLFTSLRGEAGDYKVSLEQGTSSYRDPISGEVKTQERRLDFSLTPQCAIKIFRKRATVGGRVAVSVMTFDPAGEMRNRFTFAEGTASVNFGEEVVRIQDISFKTEKKQAAKKAGGEAHHGGESGSGESGSGESSSSGGESGSGESGSSESSSSGGESSGGSNGGFGDGM